MADLPRWVDRSDVDSTAMLSAFMAYHHETSAMLKERYGMSYQPIWEGHLWSIMHKGPPGLPSTRSVTMPMRIPQKPCREQSCPRCGVRGGYVFRWYSPYWAKAYNRMRRPGSWEAPEPLRANLKAGGDHRMQHERFWLPWL